MQRKSEGNWWEGSATTQKWGDEVYGAEARASIKAMLLHWET